VKMESSTEEKSAISNENNQEGINLNPSYYNSFMVEEERVDDINEEEDLDEQLEEMKRKVHEMENEESKLGYKFNIF